MFRVQSRLHLTGLMICPQIMLTPRHFYIVHVHVSGYGGWGWWHGGRVIAGEGFHSRICASHERIDQVS
jgi:hypothetical protein